MKKIFLSLAMILTLLRATAFAAEENESSVGVEYTSKTYGFKVMCPAECKVVVMPKGYLDEPNKHGERLIFANDGMDILYGYEIILDAFDTNAVPNFNKDKKKILDDYVAKQKDLKIYEVVEIINVSKGNKGVFMVPAAGMEITNDDGTVEVIPIDAPDASVFFRTKSGRCVAFNLIAEKPDQEILDNFRKSVATFQDATDLSMPKETDKKSKKSKK